MGASFTFPARACVRLVPQARSIILAMQRFATPLWVRRFAALALMAGAYAGGVWTDLAHGRWPDYFDVQTAVMAMLFAWVLTETAMPLLEKLPRRQPVFAAGAALVGAVYVSLAHAAPFFLSGLLQSPFGGLALLRSVIEGLFFTLRVTLLPAIVCGTAAGVVSGLLLLRSVDVAVKAASTRDPA